MCPYANNINTASFYLHNSPKGPTLTQIEQALQPCLVHINPDIWEQAKIAYNNRPRESGTRSFNQNPLHLIQSFESRISSKPSPIFDSILLTNRCARRYPAYIGNQGSVIFDVKKSKRVKQKLISSSLPREFRQAFQPIEAGVKLYFDLKTCHPSILGSLANDQNMLNAVANDFHQHTGDIFLRDKISEAPIRRNIGKSINSAIISGARPSWIEDRLHRISNTPGYDSSNPSRIINVLLDPNNEDHNKKLVSQKFEEWWAPFTATQAYKEQHLSHIKNLNFQGKGYRIRWSGRTMLNIDTSTLNGLTQIKGWPKEIHLRRLKAQQSAFTGLLRSYESALMDLIFVAAHRLGFQLILPLFDGAIWFCPENNIPHIKEFETQVRSIIQSWGMMMRFDIKIEQF